MKNLRHYRRKRIKWINRKRRFVTLRELVQWGMFPRSRRSGTYTLPANWIPSINQAAWTIIPKGKPRPSWHLGILPADLKSRSILKQEQTENE